MKKGHWFLYDSGSNHPFLNMAIDEVLLQQWECAPVMVRFYAWSPPGLSLGYFQKYDEMKNAGALQESGAVITRRITGGDAILHINELTFSLVGREGDTPFHGAVASSYHRIHGALAKGFERFGVQSRMRAQSSEELSSLAHKAAGRCFYRVTSYDLVADDKKLVGSAQRRTLGKALHHGSVPISANPMTPQSADLSTLYGQKLTYEETALAVCRGIEEYFGVRLEAWRPDQAFMAEAKKLAKAKYGADYWIRRR